MKDSENSQNLVLWQIIRLFYYQKWGFIENPIENPIGTCGWVIRQNLGKNF